MDASHDSGPEADPVANITGGENAAPPELPPSHARVFRVAAGLDEWTPAERAWLKDNPKWLIYEQEFREALRRHEERLAGRHVDRIRQASPTGRDPPTR